MARVARFTLRRRKTDRNMMSSSSSAPPSSTKPKKLGDKMQRLALVDPAALRVLEEVVDLWLAELDR